MKKQSGFTLVELMIVVAIIGILAAIAIPKFADMLEKSREGATKGNLSSLKSAVSIFYGDQQGNYPNNLDNATTTNVDGLTYVFIQSYMDNIPPVKATGKNPVNVNSGYGPGVGNSNAFMFTGTAGSDWSTPAFAADSTGKGWKYGRGASGAVWVNSKLLDMSGKSYTIFGFE